MKFQENSRLNSSEKSKIKNPKMSFNQHSEIELVVKIDQSLHLPTKIKTRKNLTIVSKKRSPKDKNKE
jgi:hypothetical protein